MNKTDDITGAYLKVRQESNLTPAQQRKQVMDIDPVDPVEAIGKSKFNFFTSDVLGAFGPGADLLRAGASAKEVLTGDKITEKPVAVAKDIVKGATEAYKQIPAGVMSAGKEIGSAVESLIDFFNIPQIVQVTNEKGEIDFDLLTRSEFEKKGGKRIADEVIADPAKSVTGGLMRGVSQFLTGFLPTTKALEGAGFVAKIGSKVGPKAAKIVTGMTAGAITDAAVFDPHGDRLSDLIEKFPVLKNPVTGYLAADPEDGEAEGRFKNAIEGLAIGALSDGLFAAVKAVRGSKIAKFNAEKSAAEADQIEALAKVDDATEKPMLDDAEGVDAESLKVVVDDEKPAFEMGDKKAGDERALNINLDRVESSDDVKALLENVGKEYAPSINEARREIITNEQTKLLADNLNMTPANLLKRRRGEAFNAEQAIAARNILVSSGETLVKLAKKAKLGADEDLLAFRRAMTQHHAIQLQVSGLTAEAGRALQSFNIKSVGGKKRQQLISEMLDSTGGAKSSQKIADMISQLDNPQQVNAFVDQATKATNFDMLYEAWINGLLSSPATHTVNIIGNAMTAAWSVGERKVASLIGKGLGVQSIPEGETTQMFYGMIEGAKDGMRLAYKALKTDKPSDILTKQELAGRRAISAENLELTGIPGRFADFIGKTVRVPGRLLTSSDEFFKSVGYRMELHAQAFRQATGEGLNGEALSNRVYEIIQNPPENIDLASIDYKRYQTFTKPLGESGQKMQEFIHKTPGLRVVVPFVATPANIMKYVGERTPLSFMAPQIRAEIAAGGARRDLALAKIATGSMIMASVADMTTNGQITGAGPTNPDMRNIKRATGWAPYSIKVGDTYVAYNRLDPVGATIGIAADIAEIIGQATEAEALDIATAITVSVAQNVTSKTYLSGLSELFEVLASTSPDPEKNSTKARLWIERMGGSIVPAGVAQLERTMSPELSATYGILEKIKSRIPGYSDDLPPRRNIFGEPIVLSGGIGLDIMSPIYISKDKNDPVADEIVKQKTMLRMPVKSIDGVKLDTKMYDEYIKYYAGYNNRFVKMPLKQKLSEIYNTSVYRNATDGAEGGKSVLIKAVFDGYREAAKQMMRENMPKLQSEIDKKKTEKYKKLGAFN